MRKTHTLFIQNKLQRHIDKLLGGRTLSEKLPKIPLLGPSLNHLSFFLDLSNIRKVESF